MLRINLISPILAAAVLLGVPSNMTAQEPMVANVAPIPSPGGLTQVIAGTDDVQALVEAQKFTVASVWRLDPTTQQWATLVVGAPGFASTLSSLSPTDVVTLRSSHSQRFSLICDECTATQYDTFYSNSIEDYRDVLEAFGIARADAMATVTVNFDDFASLGGYGVVVYREGRGGSAVGYVEDFTTDSAGMRHEIAHAVQQTFFRTYHSWLAEGIAMNVDGSVQSLVDAGEFGIAAPLEFGGCCEFFSLPQHEAIDLPVPGVGASLLQMPDRNAKHALPRLYLLLGITSSLRLHE